MFGTPKVVREVSRPAPDEPDSVGLAPTRALARRKQYSLTAPAITRGTTQHGRSTKGKVRIMAQLPYMTPASLISLRAKAGRKLSVGDVLDLHAGDEIVMAPHPVFGAIPQVLVTQLTEDGRFALGEFTCTHPECNAVVVVHPGDLFQKRRCPKCQKSHQGKAKRGIRTPEDEVAAQAAKEQAKAEKQAAKAKKSFEDALAKAEKAKVDAEARLAKLQADAQARAQLIADEAKRQGVEVSPNAPQVATATA